MPVALVHPQQVRRTGEGLPRLYPHDLDQRQLDGLALQAAGGDAGGAHGLVVRDYREALRSAEDIHERVRCWVGQK